MAAPAAASLYAAAGASSTLLDSIFKTDAVGSILLMVNLCVLAVGTLWLMWNLLAAIAQSAWDGELLGKRFHTLWMPIRNAIGISMLIPAFSGWGAAQLILYQAAKMGAGAANMAISRGAGTFTAPKAADFATPSNANYFQQASRIYDMHRCRETAKIRAQQMADPAAELGGSAKDWERFVDLAGCGQIDRIPAGALSEAHMAATRTLDATTQALAARVAAGAEERGPVVPDDQINLQLRQAAQAYRQAIDSAAKAALETKIGQINAPARGDWLGFGFKTIAAAQAAREVNGATGKTAVMKGSRIDGEAAATLQTDPGDPISATESFSASTDINGNAATRSMGVKEFLAALKNAPEMVLEWFFGNATRGALTLMGDGGDLIGALQGVGTTLLSLAGGAVAALLALAAAAIWLGPLAISLIPGFLGVTAIVFSIVVPMAVMGVTLAAYIPMVPAIFWALAIVGWLLTVAEALFMAPLWAFIHLETEGEGMGQKTEKGYAFIMNLILRPLVLVFTFTIAGVLLNTVWAMLGAHIAGTMKSVDLISFSGIFLFIGFIFVLVTTATAMVYKVYGAAMGLADAIPAWLGTNFHNYTGQISAGDGFGKGDQMRPSRPGGGQSPGKAGGSSPVGGADRPVSSGGSSSVEGSGSASPSSGGAGTSSSGGPSPRTEV